MSFRLKSYYLFSVPVDFRLSWGKMGYSRHLIFELEDEKGNKGLGEGVLYNTTHLKMPSFIDKDLIPFLNKNRFKSFKAAREVLGTKFVAFEPAVAFALDTALWDMEGKIKKKASFEIFGGKERAMEITEEIFITSLENTKREAKQLKKNGTKYIKLKVGASLELNSEAIKVVNDIGKGKLKIKLDANRVFNVEQVNKFVSNIKKSNIVLFEEPAGVSFKELQKLKKVFPLPIMLDESIRTIADLNKAIKTNCFDVLNIKLTRLGGITNAREYIKICKRNNIAVSLGCSEELDIGMRAILSLGQAVKKLYGLEGLGNQRLNLYLGNKIKITNGKVSLSKSTIGMGADIDLQDITNKVKDRGGFIYSPNTTSKSIFLAQEFIGIWKTRAENVLLRAQTLV